MAYPRSTIPASEISKPIEVHEDVQPSTAETTVLAESLLVTATAATAVTVAETVAKSTLINAAIAVDGGAVASLAVVASAAAAATAAAAVVAAAAAELSAATHMGSGDMNSDQGDGDSRTMADREATSSVASRASIDNAEDGDATISMNPTLAAATDLAAANIRLRSALLHAWLEDPDRRPFRYTCNDQHRRHPHHECSNDVELRARLRMHALIGRILAPFEGEFPGTSEAPRW